MRLKTSKGFLLDPHEPKIRKPREGFEERIDPARGRRWSIRAANRTNYAQVTLDVGEYKATGLSRF